MCLINFKCHDKIFQKYKCNGKQKKKSKQMGDIFLMYIFRFFYNNNIVYNNM